MGGAYLLATRIGVPVSEELLRKSRIRGGSVGTTSDEVGRSAADRDVFAKVIEAARHNGLTVEEWLKNAIKRADEPKLSPDAKALRQLLDVQYRSRMEADRLAREAYEDQLVLSQSPSSSVPDESLIPVPDTDTLLTAIDGLAHQLADQKDKPSVQGRHQQDRPSHRSARHDAQADLDAEPDLANSFNMLRTPGSDMGASGNRVSALRARLAELRRQIDQIKPDHTGPEPAPANQTHPPRRGAAPADQSSDPDHSLLARLEGNLQTIGRSLQDLPTREDLSPLQPLAQLQLKMQQEQAALKAQIGALETTLDAFQPASHQDMVGLLDMAIDKIALVVSDAKAKSGPSDFDHVTRALDQMQQQLDMLPAEIAQIQPNPQSLISFLPSRDMLETMEATLGRVEALLLDAAKAAPFEDQSPGMPLVHQAADSLLSRLDDTIKRFDQATLSQQKQVSQTVDHMLGSHDHLAQTLSAQISRLEESVMAELSDHGSAKTAASDASFEAALSTEMGQVKSLLSDLVARQKEQSTQLQDVFSRRATDAAQSHSDEAAREREALLAPILDALDGLSAQIELQHQQSKPGSDSQSDKTRSTFAHVGLQLSGLEREVGDLKQMIGEVLAERSAHHAVAADSDGTQTTGQPADCKEVNQSAADAAQTGQDGLKSDQTKSAISDPDSAVSFGTNTGKADKHVKRPKYQEVLPPRTPNAQHKSGRGADRADPNAGAFAARSDHSDSRPPRRGRSDSSHMDFVAAARRAGRTPHGSSQTQTVRAGDNTTALTGLTRTIAWIKDLFAKDDGLSLIDIDPNRRRKILFAGAAILAVSIALVITLQGTQTGEQDPQDMSDLGAGPTDTKPMTSALARGETAPGLTNTIPRSGSLGLTDTPLGLGSSGALNGHEGPFSVHRVSVDLADPVSTTRMVSEHQASNTHYQGASVLPIARPVTDFDNVQPFVAPAPSGSIGPLALRYYAAIGDPAAQFEIARRYAKGFGVQRDMVQAVNWYRRAAASGLAPAQYHLGSLLEQGRGVVMDKQAAAKLYRQAAAAGHLRAMYNLGVLYASGAVTPQGQPDYAAAHGWFLKAAQAGIRDAQFNLAVLFAKGAGVQASARDAYYWFALAALSGDGEATGHRTSLTPSLKQHLGAEALADLDADIANWRPVGASRDSNQVATPDGGWDAKPLPPMADMALRNHEFDERQALEGTDHMAGRADGSIRDVAAIIQRRFPRQSDI